MELDKDLKELSESIPKIKVSQEEEDNACSHSSGPSEASNKSSCDDTSSVNSVSDLLERDNWKSRVKYLPNVSLQLASPGASSSSMSGEEQDDLMDTNIKTTSGDLDPAEYAHLDRYGFIHVPSQASKSTDAIPIAPLCLPTPKILKHSHSDQEDSDERKKRLDEREASRSLKWLEMLAQLQAVPVKQWPEHHDKFENRLAKGIPDCIRCQVWPLFASTKPSTVSTLPLLGYRELYLRISGYERQIDLDIERTLRDHVMFKIRFSSAQVSLFKILVAYSNFDREVGYCQGMSTVAAFLLLYLPEETAFAALKGVMSECRSLYMAGFPQLFETFHIHDRLTRKYLPRLHNHLKEYGIESSIYATKWYLTLFLGFPFALATRIWDLFLFYGFDVLPCVAIAILRIVERHLLDLDYERSMQYLSRLPDAHLHPSQVIRMAVRLHADIQGNEKHRGFRKYRDEYAVTLNSADVK